MGSQKINGAEGMIIPGGTRKSFDLLGGIGAKGSALWKKLPNQNLTH